MPTVLEAGTLNIHGIAGLLSALEWRKQVGEEKIRQKECFLADRFYRKVRELPGVQIYEILRAASGLRWLH